jgi:hypothetical protein
LGWSELEFIIGGFCFCHEFCYVGGETQNLVRLIGSAPDTDCAIGVIVISLRFAAR